MSTEVEIKFIVGAFQTIPDPIATAPRNGPANVIRIDPVPGDVEEPVTIITCDPIDVVTRGHIDDRDRHDGRVDDLIERLQEIDDALRELRPSWRGFLRRSRAVVSAGRERSRRPRAAPPIQSVRRPWTGARGLRAGLSFHVVRAQQTDVRIDR